MAFFEFLVRGADVSVFHGFQLCGPCSLEFLAGRSEALIYQDVLSVRCVRGKGNSDNSTRTPACSQLRGALTQVWKSKASVTCSGSVRNGVFWHQCGHFLESVRQHLWLHVDMCTQVRCTLGGIICSYLSSVPRQPCRCCPNNPVLLDEDTERGLFGT